MLLGKTHKVWLFRVFHTHRQTWFGVVKTPGWRQTLASGAIHIECCLRNAMKCKPFSNHHLHLLLHSHSLNLFWCPFELPLHHHSITWLWHLWSHHPQLRCPHHHTQTVHFAEAHNAIFGSLILPQWIYQVNPNRICGSVTDNMEKHKGNITAILASLPVWKLDYQKDGL